MLSVIIPLVVGRVSLLWIVNQVQRPTLARSVGSSGTIIIQSTAECPGETPRGRRGTKAEDATPEIKTTGEEGMRKEIQLSTEEPPV